MKILYLGDIVGEKTIPAIKKAIDEIKSEYKINLVLANGENPSILLDITSGKDIGTLFIKK